MFASWFLAGLAIDAISVGVVRLRLIRRFRSLAAGEKDER
jgi:hypothetical protein